MDYNFCFKNYAIKGIVNSMQILP